MRMRKVLWLALPLIVIAVVAAGVLGACVKSGDWTSAFMLEPDELVSTGRNPYFVLEPGYTLVLEGEGAQLTITVLNETKKVDGVVTRVVEERETKGGKLTEVARNYFAISKRTNDVFYFGEDVDMYKDGKVVNHDGSWLSGVNGSKFGLMMPGRALIQSRYYQEVAPNIAMDRATIGANSSAEPGSSLGASRSSCAKRLASRIMAILATSAMPAAKARGVSVASRLVSATTHSG